MTLTPNTQITQENAALLKAGDWLLRIHDGALAQYYGSAVFHPDDAPRVAYSIGGSIQGNAPFYAFTYIGPDLGDGWIGWGGGARPHPPTTCVDVRLRDGRTMTLASAFAPWWHEDGPDDIIAFRPALAKPAEVPFAAEDGCLACNSPTPASVDWNVVGPKMVEALKEALAYCEHIKASMFGVEPSHAETLRAAIAAAQSNGDDR